LAQLVSETPKLVPL